jgi:hypothetical protein
MSQTSQAPAAAPPRTGIAIDPSEYDGRKAGGRIKNHGGMYVVRESRPAGGARKMREWRAQHNVRFRLRRPDGAYANIDLSGFCSPGQERWIGFANQLEAVRRARPDLADCIAVEVMPARNLAVPVDHPKRGRLGLLGSMA